MQKMNGWARMAILICLLSMVAACGQKGDLYLPEGLSLTYWLS